MAITRTAWTDDDGTGTTGTVLNNAAKTTLYNEIDGRWSEVTVTDVGNQDDFDYSEADVLRCNNATLLTLRGLLAPASPVKPGKRLVIYSVGAGQVDLADRDTNSAAANRIVNGVNGTISLAPGAGRVSLVYDDIADRWRVVHHDQGEWITRTFDAGDYTASGALTWTVASGDVLTMAYFLVGTALHINFDLTDTSTGGTADTTLVINLPGGFTADKNAHVPIRFEDNGTAGIGYAVSLTSETIISIKKVDNSNWSNASTNATDVQGQITIEVGPGEP
jgi:hypothetical protein